MKVLFNPIQQNYNNKTTAKRPSFKEQQKLVISPIEAFFIDKFKVSTQNINNRGQLLRYWKTLEKKVGLTRKSATQMLKNEIFTSGLQNYSVPEMLAMAGIACLQDKDGMYTLVNYFQPNTTVTLSDLGIDENKLLKRVKAIHGIGEFERSEATSLGSVKKIDGNALMACSKLKSLGNLEEVSGDLVLSFSDVKDLGNLRTVRGKADFGYTKLKDLGNLRFIGKDAWFPNSDISDLGALERIGGDAIFTGNKKIKSLKNLESIGGNGLFRWTNIEDLGALEIIGGTADFNNTKLTGLSKLKKIGKDAHFEYSRIKETKDFGQLEEVRGNTYFVDPKKVILAQDNLYITVKMLPAWMETISEKLGIALDKITQYKYIRNLYKDYKKECLGLPK